jgi:glycogen debranching enzyme
MHIRAILISVVLAPLSAAHAQSGVFTPLPSLAFDTTGPVIRAHTEPLKPFTVAGERGVLVGQQDGTFEAWILPAKVLSHLTIEAEVEGYTVPIDVNEQSAEIEVRPDRTVITYAHIGFTVRQIMFSPSNPNPGSPATGPQTGPIVLFEFDCLHPTDFTLRFTPELRWMWPERNEGVPSAEWVGPPTGASGYYVLHSDYPDFAAAVTIPGARPGILAPYQERPQVHPVELRLHIDPARDHGRLYPLLMAYGANRTAANTASLGAALEKLNAGIAASYQAHAETYKKLLASSVSIETPDKALNEAFQWAVVSIEQLKTRTIAGQSSVSSHDSGSVTGHDFSRAESRPTENDAFAPEETALVAGYFASGDSARPGFGWFFGRDALYTLYAVNGYGDFALSKSELEFLIHRQRTDGKIMHEWSQTAAAIDWQSFPYMYAAADATPLFLLATLDYVRASGDIAFLTTHRDAIDKAWAFETSHAPGPDQGGNGIYENTQGTGWVESWPGGMPHQEVYLALLDQQASAAMAQLETLLGNKEASTAAHQRAEAVAKTIESQFYDREKGCYAFSRNRDGSLDRTTTIYPSLGWWTSPSITGNPAYLAHSDDCLKQMAAHSLNTDWGLRDVSNEEKIYDGMSYHQGSVWPLFTGWAALAEYRGGQPLAGYQMLMENANLTRAQDLGAATELLSGDFYVPMGRSTSHQLWSSAMVITPTLRGLFGLDIDAPTKTITVNPHLPANWDHAEIRNLRVGAETIDLAFQQSKGQLTISVNSPGPSGVKLVNLESAEKAQPGSAISLPRPAVAVVPFFRGPTPGERTGSIRILREEYSPRQLVLTLEGPAGAQVDLPVVLAAPVPKLHVEGASLLSQPRINDNAGAVNFPAVSVLLPPGEGWKTITVTLTW